MKITKKPIWDIDPMMTPVLSAFEDIFANRNNTIRSYWDFYYKSGILRTIGSKFRKRFSIPKLDPKTDFYCELDSESEERHGSHWIDISGMNTSIEMAVREILKSLYLPNNASPFLLYYLLYAMKYSTSYPLYNWTDLLSCLLNRERLPEDNLGYSQEELKFVKSLLQLGFVVGDVGIKTSEQIKSKLELNKTLKDLLDQMDEFQRNAPRKFRPLRELEKDVLILKALKNYKKAQRYQDYAIGEEVMYKITSKEIVESILADDSGALKSINITSEQFRKQVSRLIAKFPFLESYPDINIPK